MNQLAPIICPSCGHADTLEYRRQLSGIWRATMQLVCRDCRQRLHGQVETATEAERRLEDFLDDCLTGPRD
jgi:hypothetical protein